MLVVLLVHANHVGGDVGALGGGGDQHLERGEEGRQGLGERSPVQWLYRKHSDGRRPAVPMPARARPASSSLCFHLLFQPASFLSFHLFYCTLSSQLRQQNSQPPLNCLCQLPPSPCP